MTVCNLWSEFVRISSTIWSVLWFRKNSNRTSQGRGLCWSKLFVKSQLNQEGKGSMKSEADTDLSDPGFPRTGSDSDHQVKKASAPSQVHCLVPVGQTLAAAPEAKDDQQPLRSAQTLLLRNKPMVFEPLWERIQRKHTQEEHHTSKYKLDQKVRHFSPFWLWLLVWSVRQTAGSSTL